MLPRSGFGFTLIVVYLVLAIEETAASGNLSEYTLHRNRRQTKKKFCPPLRTLNTIILACTVGNVDVPCDKNVKSGTIVKAACKRYHKPSVKPDYSLLICKDNGKWDHQLFYCIPECGSSNLEEIDRIVNGIDADVGAFPWHAGLYYRKVTKQDTVTWEQKCSGSLITDQFVLTVAHCLTDVVESEVRVALGKYYRDWDKTESSEVKRTVSKIIYQRDFSKKTFAFDIALLRLGEKVVFGDYVMPVCRGFPSGSNFLESKDLYVAGWGLTKEEDITSASDTLLYNTVTVVGQDICKRKAPSVYPTFDKFCTTKNGQSKVSTVQSGDSGGGITSQFDGLHFILGVVSVKSNGYSIFTNVTWPYNVIWIESQIRKDDPSFRWEQYDVSEYQNNNRGCFLPEASSSRRFCSLAPGCENCDINDRLCFIPPGSNVYRVRVVCSPGYTLRSPYSGGDVAICMNGQWYPSIPECHRYQYIPGDPWEKVTWQEARDICVDEGYLLATIKSEDEGKSFIEAVSKQFNATGIPPSSVWIGLSDVRVEGTFEWVDGSVLSENDYTMWLKNEPSDHDSLEHCVEANAGCGRWTDLYNWNDNYCSDLQYYFCKKIIFSNSTDQRFSGVFGKKNYNGSPRYQYFPGNPWVKVTWEKARLNCLAMGSQLAVVRSEDQQEVFEKAVAKQFNDTDTTPSSVWIGLSQGKNRKVRLLYWEDGSIHNAWRKCAYKNWLPEEPGLDLSQNCAEAAAGGNFTETWPNGTIYQWNANKCSLENYYFCSVKL